jgi:hypothetical protein
MLVSAALPSYAAPLTDFTVVPIVAMTGERTVPPTERGRAIVVHLSSIEADTRSGRYAHRTDVDPSSGHYHWDCSGMVGWMLRRHAPAAFASLHRERPVAADYARVIAAASTDASRGFRRIASIEDVRAGDVFAWRAPEALRSAGSTGHVGFVLGTPRRVVSGGSVWSVPIADSTTLPHELDSRLARLDRDGGLGTGVMTFAADPGGTITHYGWMGVLSPVYIETTVVFGRLP